MAHLSAVLTAKAESAVMLAMAKRMWDRLHVLYNGSAPTPSGAPPRLFFPEDMATQLGRNVQPPFPKVDSVAFPRYKWKAGKAAREKAVPTSEDAALRAWHKCVVPPARAKRHPVTGQPLLGLSWRRIKPSGFTFFVSLVVEGKTVNAGYEADPVVAARMYDRLVVRYTMTGDIKQERVRLGVGWGAVSDPSAQLHIHPPPSAPPPQPLNFPDEAVLRRAEVRAEGGTFKGEVACAMFWRGGAKPPAQLSAVTLRKKRAAAAASSSEGE